MFRVAGTRQDLKSAEQDEKKRDAARDADAEFEKFRKQRARIRRDAADGSVDARAVRTEWVSTTSSAGWSRCRGGKVIAV